MTIDARKQSCNPTASDPGFTILPRLPSGSRLGLAHFGDGSGCADDHQPGRGAGNGEGYRAGPTRWL